MNRAIKIKDGKPQMSEAQFTRSVIDLAHAHHWRVAHFRAAMDSKGRWKTAVQGDGAGFPDLVLARSPRVIFAELKAEGRKVSKNQLAWIEALSCGYHGAYIWTPSDWLEIEEVLK